MAVTSRARAPGTLPVPLTSFVGRQRDLQELEALIGEPEGRLVTLVGPGGVGKTRLALELAPRLVSISPEIAFVELDLLVNPDLLLPTVANALGVREQPREALIDTVVTAITDRQGVLLLLDTCEHVVGACALIVERLLRSCPELRVLATSRERLDVPGEAVYPVSGLALAAEEATGQDILKSEASHLFVERAHQLKPDFVLDEPGALALARICRRLDGIPLAIELAATAARAMSLDDIALRLDDRFHLLQAAVRTTSRRHHTLRAAIDWSHQLLEAEEATLFRHLAVFSGGFTLDAVEAVEGREALIPLLRLIDKSLVVLERRGRGQRYRMLDTVREYAAEKLVEGGDASAVRDRHRDCYVAFAEQAVDGLIGADQAVWVERVEAEHGNLKAALTWCQEDPVGAEKEERLAGALGRFWRDRGYTRDGFAWLTHAAQRRPGAVSLGRGRALNWAAVIAQHGDFAHQEQQLLLQESVAVLRQVGAPSDLSLALRHAWSNQNIGRLEGDTEIVDTGPLEEALALAQGAGDRREIGFNLLYLTHVALNRADMAEARRLADETLTAVRELDANTRLQAVAQLGRVALAQGEHARAEMVYREMLGQPHDIGDRIWWSDAYLGLAGALRARGDIAAARGCFRDLVAELRGVSAAYLLRRVLLGLAMLEAGAGNERRAARLIGALGEGTGSVTGWPLEGFQLGPDLAAMRARFKHEPFAAEVVGGRTLSVDQALDEALADTPPARSSGVLTARECEVAALVSEGHTNRQIAAALVIAEPTAERHVANILSKLGLHSRAQIAAWHARSRVDLPA
jgi:predicted ATPase/DNA-binding CsgD family transcriptional regulator